MRFDPAVHLAVADVAVDNPRSPAMLQVTIKQSKTDPFRKGVQLFIGKKGSMICPLAAMMDFLLVRGTAAGFLLCFEDGTYLTRQRLVAEVRERSKKLAWTKAGIVVTVSVLGPRRRRRSAASRIQ